MMEIRVHDARDGAVLLCGVPFPEGGLQPGEVLGAWDDDGRSLPLWWEERAYWGDGSVKWIFLHVRLGEVVEVVRVGPADTAAELPPPPLLVRPDAETSLLRVGDFTLRMGRDAWVLTCASGTCRIEPTRIFTNPEQEHGGAWHVDVVEPSPLAPLLRVREKASAGACLDHLLRVDPLRATLDWQQRVRFLASETCALRALETVIDFSTETRANSWTWEVSPAPRSRLLVPRPGILVLDGGMEQDGRPRMAMHGALGSIELIKGWQRAPCALKVEAGGRVHVEMYPQDVPGLVVRPGTSFRHWVRLGVGRKAAQQARWSLDPEAACASGAFGPVMARTERSQRLFPGYEQAIRLCLDGGRLARLDKEGAETQGPPAALADEEAQDEEYFGLQHYGDWPMKLGAYGGTRRMYADNEYDTPYAYALQFARTGNPDYWNIAYWSAVHMADVDCKATDGDMRYHG